MEPEFIGTTPEQETAYTGKPVAPEAKSPVLRCKVRANDPTKHMGHDGVQYGETVSLYAVVGPEGSENASWSKATPSAQFTLYISNPRAFGNIVGDQEYYVDLTPAK